MKVLQLLSSAGYYGAESMLLNLCASQKNGGSANALLVFYNAHQPNVALYQEAERRGLNPAMVRCEGRIDWRALQEIRRYIREQAIDIIHAHGYKADLYGYAAARREKKPIVATCHNWRDVGRALSIYNRLDRQVLKRFDGIAAVSETVAEKLRQSGVPPSRIQVIANGIDVRPFEEHFVSAVSASPAGLGPVIGVVARLDLQKGFEFLFHAVRELAATNPGLQVMIVGDGPDRGAIEKMIVDLGLESRVTLAGERSDMPAIYAAMDIFVLPSLNEGLPMTVLEAMAASRPVIATRVGAIPSVIADGRTGLLVEPRDGAGLASAIARLTADPDLRSRLAREARLSVMQNYTADIMARKYADLYDRAIAKATTVSAKARTLEVGKAKSG